MRAETSRWLWESSEESSPPSVSQQLPVPPQPLGQTSPGGHLGGRAGQRASPCVPFPVAAAGFSYVLFSPVVSGDWHLGNLRACLEDAVGPGLGGDRLPGPHPWRGAALQVLRLPGGGHHRPPGLGGGLVGAPWCLRALMAVWW